MQYQAIEVDNLIKLYQAVSETAGGEYDGVLTEAINWNCDGRGRVVAMGFDKEGFPNYLLFEYP